MIAGKDCQKMYCYNRDNAGETDYVAALTEESGMVWCFYLGETEETLLYDFGLSKGDHLPESLEA